MYEWLKRTVLEKTPAAFGYDTGLWRCGILAGLLEQLLCGQLQPHEPPPLSQFEKLPLSQFLLP